MIDRVRIQGLRGIREASLSGLSGLTILVGQNGAGKSTILEALAVAASPTPADAVGRIVRRRTSVANGAPWLLWRANEMETATVSINSNRPDDRVCRIRKAEFSELPSFRSGEPVVFSMEVRAWLGSPSDDSGSGKLATSEWIVGFNRLNEYVGQIRTKGNWSGPYVRLIDPAPGGNQSPLHKIYSSVVKQGNGTWARDLLRSLISDFDNLQILTDDDGEPVVHVIYKDRSVPVGLAGDGVQVLTRVCLELAGAGVPGGLVLLEEPEVHSHPGSLVTMSRAIVETVKREIQVVLSTHSLDLMKFLIDESRKQGLLERLSVFQVRLLDGKAVWSRIPGEDAELRIEAIGDDLR